MSQIAGVEIRLTQGDAVEAERAARLISDAFFVHEIMTADRISADGLRAELGATGRMIEAWADGELVGTALVIPGQDVQRPLERPIIEQHLPALYFGLAGVHPGHMRRGIGRAMLAAAERLALAEGAPRLLLSALREMGNVDYYRRHGYRVLHAWDYQDRGVPHQFTVMGKDLG